MAVSNDDGSARIAELEQQMREVTRRLATLERAAGPFQGAGFGPGFPPGPGTRHGPGEPALPPGHRPGGRGGEDGEEGGGAAVGYWGSGQFGSRRAAIRQQMTLSGVFAAEPEGVTRVFAALASPARIVLLRTLVDGPRTSQQLREVLDAPSVGQLYHHLRELLAAGLVVQPSRSVYEIPPGKVVAVCVAISAAAHLMSASHQYPEPPADPDNDEAPEQDEPPQEASPGS
jgi:ArsR family transcriptional regulator, arsenate/arsenite/antimonite-responsive transcriptional repressor